MLEEEDNDIFEFLNFNLPFSAEEFELIFFGPVEGSDPQGLGSVVSPIETAEHLVGGPDVQAYSSFFSGGLAIQLNLDHKSSLPEGLSYRSDEDKGPSYNVPHRRGPSCVKCLYVCSRL